MLPATFGLVWLVLANLTAMLPTRDRHWRAACALIVTGLPLLLWTFAACGTVWAVAFGLAASSLLRWPLYFLWVWLKGHLQTKV